MGTNSEVPKSGKEAIRNILARLTVLERKPNNLPDVSAYANPDTLAVRNADGNVQTGTPVVADDAVPFEYLGTLVPTGTIVMWPGGTVPSDYLLAEGDAVSRAGYATLFATLNPTIGNPTITVATPAVLTLTAHGLQTGQQVYLTTTGALPTGLTENTNYWVVSTGVNTLNLATSLANAMASTPVVIATSGTQSGTHSLMTTHGVGDGSTTFNLPIVGSPPQPMASGFISITPSAANTPTPGAITFPAGLFTLPPRVIVTADSTVPGTVVTGVAATAVTTSGATIYLTRASTTSTGIHWVAVQDNVPKRIRYIIKA